LSADAVFKIVVLCFLGSEMIMVARIDTTIMVARIDTTIVL
jgi:hypothetical protein